MKGLIKKDFLILKRSSKMILFLLVIYFICSIDANGMESSILPFMMAVLCNSTFSYDEYNKWDPYAMTLPGKKNTVIAAKYAMTLVVMMIAFVFTVVISYIMGIVRGDYSLGISFQDGLLGVSLGILAIAIIFPLIIKFGLEKGRIAIMIGSIGLAAFFMIVGSIIEVPKNVAGFLEVYLVYLLPLLAMTLLIGSYFLSTKIYSKKEF